MLESWIDLDRASRIPLAEQIYRQIRDRVRSGHIGLATPFPSSRALAATLGVSRNSVNAAYELLRGEAIITIRAGAVPVLVEQESPPRPSLPASPEIRLSRRGTALAYDRNDAAYHDRSGTFRPGQPDAALFPRDLWARALRRSARTLADKTVLYDHAEGLPALRAVLSRYLAEARGVKATPEHLHIVPTVQSALSMLAQCLVDPGDTVWIEDPGYLGARAAFADARIDPLPVDDEGSNAKGMTSVPKLIYVTPSHQYPTGARMSLPRRLALLEKARQHGAIVVEDDYDSEFLWRGRPIPALQALSDANVIYIGTVAKSLLPGLRLAYLAVPPGLSKPLAEAQLNLGLLANVHAQAAFADFIDSGHYRAHLNRISTIYRQRADGLARAIAARCGDRVRMTPSQGGLQMLAEFSPAADDRAIAGELTAKGYSVPFLSGLCHGARRSGLVIGFAQADEQKSDRFADALADALARTADVH